MTRIECTVYTDTMNVDPATYREVFRVGIPEYDRPIKQIAFDPSTQPGDSASARQTGAYVGTYHIIYDIDNRDGGDFAGVNLDGRDLIVRTGTRATGQ